MGRKGRMAVAVASAAVLSASVAGCSDDESAKLEVVLSEWLVDPSADSVQAGTVTVVADNQGGEEHELLIVKGSVEDLPIDEETGAVIEDELEEAGAVIGEVEDVEARSKKEKDFDLSEPGTYVLICNIVEEEEDGEMESHYAEGMVAEITVTE